MALLLSIALFLAIASAVTLYGYSRYVRPSLIADRLAQAEDHSFTSLGIATEAKRSFMGDLLSAIGAFIPIDHTERKFARKQLGRAGFRADSAIQIFAGVKLVCAAGFLLVGLLLREHITEVPLFKLLVIFGSCALGYFLPGLILDRMIGARQERLRIALPDALDLLVVCADAGCGLDQAILNVSRELRSVHPDLCDEFALVNYELLAGSNRADSLRNMADRTGEEELKKFVSVLVQTDRFGTSIGDALRTQSDFMRTKRRQNAEERAGKVGVKLVFPIFFFCLPSIFIVTAGPGILQLMKNLLPALKDFH